MGLVPSTMKMKTKVKELMGKHVTDFVSHGYKRNGVDSNRVCMGFYQYLKFKYKVRKHLNQSSGMVVKDTVTNTPPTQCSEGNMKQ